MINLSPYKYFYFIGIGGIGMSALARYFNTKGFEVAGYDRAPTELTDALEKEGIICHFEDNIEMIPARFLENKPQLLVIYTPAIPAGHLEFNYLLDKDYNLVKRAEALASITKGQQTIAVAGTHGKTSTASIISHILTAADVPFYAFLGGIAVNYHSNFLAPPANVEPKVMVVEADEFDRSFLQLEPDISIITAIESDHLDIYGTEENLKFAFSEFAGKLKPGGTLITHKSLNIEPPRADRHLTYCANDKADIEAEHIQVLDGKYIFDAEMEHEKLDGLTLGVPGVHNIENSLAAIVATKHLVADNRVFYKALETFTGVRRRFEVVFRNDNVIYIDDYAHHPTEIKVTLQTIRDLYPGKKLLGVFQPHLFSRTRDLADDFGKSLSMLDELILLPIYPAREQPIAGVSSRLIYEKAYCAKKDIVNKEDVIAALGLTDFDVIVTLGAGDIDRLVKPIKHYLEQNYKQTTN